MEYRNSGDKSGPNCLIVTNNFLRLGNFFAFFFNVVIQQSHASGGGLGLTKTTL